MKVVLDLTRLLREGQITEEEHQRLTRFAEQDTGSLAFNILVGCGVMAVAGAALALVQTAATAVVLGAVLMAAGIALLARYPAWRVLANISMLVAALMFGGGALILSGGTVLGYLLVAAMFVASALVAQSAMLVTLSILAVVGAVGAGTFYRHAVYEIDVTRPLLTILLCSGLALAAYRVSKQVGPQNERLCLVGARAALFFANIGFWVGSLWGDPLDWVMAAGAPGQSGAFLPPSVFILGWAVALVATGIWATRANRRWVVNVSAVFGAIHFYTQWFERLNATPVTVLVAGLLTLAAALGWWKWTSQAGSGAAQPLASR